MGNRTTINVSSRNDARTAAGHPPFNTDYCIQCAAGAHVTGFEQVGTAISMVELGQTCQHGYAERVMRIMKEGEVDLSQGESYTDTYSQLGHLVGQGLHLQALPLSARLRAVG